MIRDNPERVIESYLQEKGTSDQIARRFKKPALKNRLHDPVNPDLLEITEKGEVIEYAPQKKAAPIPDYIPREEALKKARKMSLDELEDFIGQSSPMED